jgi:hypothetical protein
MEAEMRRTRDQVKAKLLADAEVLIDEMLDWNDKTPAPTLTQIEDVVLSLRKRLGERVAEAVVGDQEATQPALRIVCPTCGCEMKRKGRKRTGVESRLGSIEIEREYYYCEQCKKGLFPPGPTVEVDGEALE